MAADVQNAFFERVRQKLNANLSLVNEIADVLEMSNDSAYRRLRGETALSLNEAFILANHFQIAGAVPFRRPPHRPPARVSGPSPPINDSRVARG